MNSSTTPNFLQLFKEYETSIHTIYSGMGIRCDRYKILDLCSGIGGFSLGLLSSGLGMFCEVKTYCDIDPFCADILKSNFGKEVIPDIKDLVIKEGEYDIIQASIPCQPHSQAGGKWRKGGSDERDLGDQFIRLVADGKPVGFLLENVGGFRTSEKGDYFKQFLTKLSKATGGDYLIEWGIYSAAQVGAIHLRKRFWVLGYKRSRLETSQPQPFLNLDPSTFTNLLNLSNPTHSFFPFFLQNHLLTHEALTDDVLKKSCDTDDLPHRRQHLKAFGNAIVPAVAAHIWKRFFLTLAALTPNPFMNERGQLPIDLSVFKGFVPTEGVLIPNGDRLSVYSRRKWGAKVTVKDKIWLPTPLASNALHPGHRTFKKGSHKHLPHALVPWRVPFVNRKTNDKLNPDFVGSMMGFPPSWLVF